MGSVVFTNLGGANNWAAATTREGMYVFTMAAVSSQLVSAYLSHVQRQEIEALIPSDYSASPTRLVEGKGLNIAIGALCGCGLLFPALSLDLYELSKSVNMGLGNMVTSSDVNVASSATALFNVPAGQTGAAILGCITLLLVVALPVLHLLSIVMITLSKLTEAELQKAYSVTEGLGEWACLDVFILALLPVAIEMGPLTHNLPGHYVSADVKLIPGCLVIGILAVLCEHVSHIYLHRLVAADVPRGYTPVDTHEDDVLIKQEQMTS